MATVETSSLDKYSSASRTSPHHPEKVRKNVEVPDFGRSTSYVVVDDPNKETVRLNHPRPTQTYGGSSDKGHNADWVKRVRWRLTVVRRVDASKRFLRTSSLVNGAPPSLKSYCTRYGSCFGVMSHWASRYDCVRPRRETDVSDVPCARPLTGSTDVEGKLRQAL